MKTKLSIVAILATATLILGCGGSGSGGKSGKTEDGGANMNSGEQNDGSSMNTHSQGNGTVAINEIRPLVPFTCKKSLVMIKLV